MKKLKDNGLPLPNLYTYDSFLFEFGIEDTEVLRKIKPVLESFGFPTKVSYGDDYSLV